MSSPEGSPFVKYRILTQSVNIFHRSTIGIFFFVTLIFNTNTFIEKSQDNSQGNSEFRSEMKNEIEKE